MGQSNVFFNSLFILDPPVFMSSPHFYQGYPKLYESINGLKPEKALHETYISVEPVRENLFSFKLRAQIWIMK